MKLWLLKRDNPNDEIGYDEYVGFVVRAEDEAQARRMTKTQGEALWSCVQLTEDGPDEIILEDYRAG